MIESILEDLSHTWGWTTEELNDVSCILLVECFFQKTRKN